MMMMIMVNICLIAILLGCNVSAEIIHEIVEEEAPVSLRCPQAEGKVTWSRDSNGHKADIFTVDGDRDIRHIQDPGRRYSSLGDKSLYIQKAVVSDSGRYWCNNEAAVELTVIPSGVSRRDATERTSVTLTCPHHVGGSPIIRWRSPDVGEIEHQKGFYVSPVDQTLTVTGLEPGNSGLYYCDGKPAVYLNVIKGNKAPPTTTSTTSTTSTTTGRTSAAATAVSSTPPLTSRDTTSTRKQGNRKRKGDKTPTTTAEMTTLRWVVNTGRTTVEQQQPLDLVFGIVVSVLLLLIIIIIIIVYFTHRLKRQGREERCPVYEEIQDGVVFQPTNASGPTATYPMTDFPAGSKHNDPTYATIPDLPLVEKTSEISLHNESPYSLAGSTFTGGNSTGSSQLTDDSYFLLVKPEGDVQV